MKTKLSVLFCFGLLAALVALASGGSSPMPTSNVAPAPDLSSVTSSVTTASSPSPLLAPAVTVSTNSVMTNRCFGLTLTWSNASPNIDYIIVYCSTNSKSVVSNTFYAIQSFTNFNTGYMTNLAHGPGITNYFFGQSHNTNGILSTIVYESSWSAFQCQIWFRIQHALTNFYSVQITNPLPCQFFKMTPGEVYTSTNLYAWTSYIACPTNSLVGIEKLWIVVP